eukprot:CFRG3010T1
MRAFHGLLLASAVLAGGRFAYGQWTLAKFGTFLAVAFIAFMFKRKENGSDNNVTTEIVNARSVEKHLASKEKDVQSNTGSGCCSTVSTPLAVTGNKQPTSGGCCKDAGEDKTNGCCKDTEDTNDTKSSDCCKTESMYEDDKVYCKILYASVKGTCRSMAKELKDLMVTKLKDIKENHVAVINLADYSPLDLEEEELKCLMVFILPTYSGGKPSDDASALYQYLEDSHLDQRVSARHLQDIRYTVFGCGHSSYSKNVYNTVGKNVDKWLQALGARRRFGLGLGDQDVAGSINGSIELDFTEWAKRLVGTYEKKNLPLGGTDGSDVYSQKDANAAIAAAEEEYESDSSNYDSEGDDNDGMQDLEDMGNMMVKMKAQKKLEASGPREMITPALRKSLTKQGYKLIGTHSGVKLCRWTKSMLRGRGGCYKHTFYGIDSHRCMEATPNLACANKCIFCWRQHTNPVGTEWKWKTDEADMIVNEAIKNHRALIKTAKGIAGLIPERYEEGLNVKHCALSLVGEPIMYPQINRFIELLHERRISSFMVTNAQFPEAITNLAPVTQLYVSVDAATPESLKKIDRPLFSDFWDRLMASLDELGRKQQRTVYRLTLVSGWNSEEIAQYAKLISRAKPHLIEIKGVTYCGTSDASVMTMQNVPWHEEVVGFVQALCDLLPEYSIASEHEHSNCVLVARNEFKIEGQWHTWIDYDKFHQLNEEFNKNGTKFTALDYVLPTPHWAVYGCEEQGFDPEEKRHYRRRQNKVASS